MGHLSILAIFLRKFLVVWMERAANIGVVRDRLLQPVLPYSGEPESAPGATNGRLLERPIAFLAGLPVLLALGKRRTDLSK